MARSYTVYVEGKPVVLTDSPLETVVKGILHVRIDDPEEIGAVIRTVKEHPEVMSVHLWAKDGPMLWERFNTLYKFVVAAGGLVTDEKGRLLVIRRLGKWDLPKGKVDPDEGIRDAALREVREECGLKELRVEKQMASTWHTYERKGRDHLKRTDWFLMKGGSTEKLIPQTEEDIVEVRWMDRDEVTRMKEDTYPSLLPVIEEWEADPSFKR